MSIIPSDWGVFNRALALRTHHGDTETRRHGDTETRRHGEATEPGARPGGTITPAPRHHAPVGRCLRPRQASVPRGVLMPGGNAIESFSHLACPSHIT